MFGACMLHDTNVHQIDSALKVKIGFHIKQANLHEPTITWNNNKEFMLHKQSNVKKRLGMDSILREEKS